MASNFLRLNDALGCKFNFAFVVLMGWGPFGEWGGREMPGAPSPRFTNIKLHIIGLPRVPHLLVVRGKFGKIKSW